MPLVDAAWSAGDITADHVRRLAGVRNHRTRSAFARDEASWKQPERPPSPSFIRWSSTGCKHADPDGADLSDVERRERRRVSLDETFSGTYSGSILLYPISGAVSQASWTGLQAG